MKKMTAKVKRPYHTRLPVEQDSLMSLVETHDVAGLLVALDTKDGPAFSMPLCPPSSKYSTREYLTKNKSAVERACELGHLDILNLFLINGCSPNLPTSDGRLVHTVLATLKSQRHLVDNGRGLVTLKLMLSRNCDINVKSFNNKTVLLQACELSDPKILRLLLRRCSEWQFGFCDSGRAPSPLHMACMKGNVACVRLLLQRLRRNDLDTKTRTHLTPLLTTIMMIRHNLSYDPKSFGYKSALTHAQYRFIAIIEMLLQAGADANAGTALDVRCIKPVPGLPGNFNALCCAMDLVDACRKKEGKSVETASVDDMYSGLVRLLAYWGAMRPTTVCSEALSERFSHIPTLLNELDAFDSMCNKETPSESEKAKEVHSPLRLIELCRSSIRLHVARCDQLSSLENVPLPKKLKEYIMFLIL